MTIESAIERTREGIELTNRVFEHLWLERDKAKFLASDYDRWKSTVDAMEIVGQANGNLRQHLRDLRGRQEGLFEAEATA